MLRDTEPRVQTQGRLHAEGDGGVYALEVPFTSGTDALLDLLPGVAWKIRASAEGFWSAEELVVATEPTEPVTVKLYPVGTVAGTLHAAGGGSLPDGLQIRARFRAGAGRNPNSSDLEGTVDCTVPGGEKGDSPDKGRVPRLECRVPSGNFHLRIRASGFVSHYFWDRTVEPGEELDLGPLELVPGASVVGWVETSDEEPLAGSHVELVPQLVDPPTAAEAARASILTVREKVDERGFFHLTGLLPGSYVLTARMEGYSPARVENLLVLENAEAELADPLVLERPLDLTLLVRPKSDPSGRGWTLRLIPSTGGRPSGGDPLLGRTDAEGSWTAEQLRGGEYYLTVMDSRGSRLKSEFFDLDASRTTLTVDVPFVEVAGRVTLGEEPVQGKVFFGGVSGAVSISADSDEEGNYSTVIPEQEEKWKVDFTAGSPRIFTRMRDVEIEADASGRARFDVELPDTDLGGEVVDQAGEPVAGARVLATSFSARKPAYVTTDDEGEFSLRGQPYDTYWLEAWFSTESESLRSRTVETSLSEESPSAVVRLVVLRMREVRGTVLSPVGSIPGAKIMALLPRVQGPFPLIVPETRTGGDGRFTLRLPAEVDRIALLVMAPGFVVRILRLELTEDVDLDIAMEQEGGGTLTIATRKPVGSFKLSERTPYLVLSDGFELNFNTLSLWASMNGVFAEDVPVLAVPLLPPDTYVVCWPDGATKNENTCESGFLPRGGRLAMEHRKGTEKHRR